MSEGSSNGGWWQVGRITWGWGVGWVGKNWGGNWGLGMSTQGGSGPHGAQD